MNLIINDSCNKKCSFCFQGEEFRNKKSMPLEKFKEYCEKELHSSNYKSFDLSILGGEPTIHKYFDKMLDYLGDLFSKNIIPNKRVMLITNGNKNKEYAKKYKELGVLLLLNASSMDSKEEMTEKITPLIENDLFFSLSFTIYDKSVVEEIIFLKEKFNINYVRLSSAVDVTAQNFDYYHENKKLFLEAIRTTERLGIITFIDCSRIPKCVYTKEEWEELENSKFVYRQEENTFGASCNLPLTEVMPDGEVVACMGLKDLGKEKFENFNNIKESTDYTIKIKMFALKEKEQKMPSVCKNCIEYKVGRCFAGCVGMSIFPDENIELWFESKK